MIVMVRGTHGSGKSTLVRRIMELYPTREVVMIPGRKRPFGYKCFGFGKDLRSVFVLGSYENVTGGGDTIPDVDTIYDFLREYDGDVLFEGILAQHSTTKLLEVHAKKPVFAIVLTTTLETAIESVRKRRLERGDDRPMSTRAIEKEFKSVLSSARRMEAAGVPMLRLDREQGFNVVGELLRSVTLTDEEAWQRVVPVLYERLAGHEGTIVVDDPYEPDTAEQKKSVEKIFRGKKITARPSDPLADFKSPGWANGFMRKVSVEQTPDCTIWNEDEGLWFESDEALRKRIACAL